MLDHEKLDVYRLGIEFIAKANDFIARRPRERGYLADQLQRAALSIVLNIASVSSNAIGRPSASTSPSAPNDRSD